MQFRIPCQKRLDKRKKPWKNPRLWWEQRESNPRPSACKADALNQLSYAPDKNSVSFETDCKYTAIFRICKFYLHFLRLFRHFRPHFKPFYLSFRVKSGNLSKKALYLQDFQWGCFGFDSIRHWTVSTSGVGSLPVNLSFQTISWQQLLCTRCVVCKAHYLNPRRQGCDADEYPSGL